MSHTFFTNSFVNAVQMRTEELKESEKSFMNCATGSRD